MKKIILSIVKFLLPAALICILLFSLRGGKNVLEGIYLIFPAIFVLQGIFCSDKPILFGAGLVLSETAFLVFVNMLYRMGSCIDLAIIYATLCVAACLIKRIILRKKHNKKTAH